MRFSGTHRVVVVVFLNTSVLDSSGMRDLFVADRWWSEWIPATGQFGHRCIAQRGQNGSVFRFGFGHRVRAEDNFALLANFGLYHCFSPFG